MKSIIITRKFNLLNIASSFEIIADNKVIGHISNGKKENLEIDNNTKEIYVEAKWFKSAKIDVSNITDGTTIILKPNIISKIGFFCLISYLIMQIFENQLNFNYRSFNFLLLIGLILNLYSTTYGSDKHITIELKKPRTKSALR